MNNKIKKIGALLLANKTKKCVSMMLVAIFVIVSCSGNVANAASKKEPTKYVNIKEGIYEICSGLDSSKVVDVSGGGTKNGTNIILNKSKKSDNQKLSIEKVRDGWYRISAIQSYKVLDVAGGKKGKAVNIQLWEYNGSDAQLWRFYKADNGNYYIKNKLGYYIDISGGKAKDKANIHVYSFHSGKAQQWKMKKISDGVLDWSKVRNTYKDKSYWNGSYKNKAWQCHGFALTVASKVTGGSDPLNWKKAYNLNNLKEGDIVRFSRPHSILITNVSGDTITYVDCNWYRRNTVKWDQKISKNKLTSKFGRLQYVLVRP